MSNTAAINLIRMILALLADSTIHPAIDEPNLVDQNGFPVSLVRRFQEIAMDRFDATQWQAQKAAMVWVKMGRPVRPEAI